MFIANIFDGLSAEFNEEKNHVDIFHFEDASNVQKAGSVLEVRFPRIVTYHCDKHVMVLWFSSLAEIWEFKVCFLCVLFMFPFCFLTTTVLFFRNLF